MSSAGEAEESSDFQYLGEGLSPAPCTERNAAQRPLVPPTPTGAKSQTPAQQPALPESSTAAVGGVPGGGEGACEG